MEWLHSSHAPSFLAFIDRPGMAASGVWTLYYDVAAPKLLLRVLKTMLSSGYLLPATAPGGWGLPSDDMGRKLHKVRALGA